MALPLFSWSQLRIVGSTLSAVSARRWNSTAASSAASTAERSFQLSTDHHVSRPRLRRATRRAAFDEQKTAHESRPLEKFQSRRWQAGDIYAPHDLSPAQMREWGEPRSPPTDIFVSLNLNPLSLYKNFSIMSEYMSPMGRIKHRRDTGLRPVNQRKMSKAIRRAIGLGLMPSVHRHPEILAAEAKARMEGGSSF